MRRYLVALAIVLAMTLAAGAQQGNFSGTWKLNLATSFIPLFLTVLRSCWILSRVAWESAVLLFASSTKYLNSKLIFSVLIACNSALVNVT